MAKVEMRHASYKSASIAQECLDYFIVFGEAHLQHLIDEYLTHDLEERPHQSLGNVPLKAAAAAVLVEGEIVCRERLGALLNRYEKAA